jgi:hypothetical protein
MPLVADGERRKAKRCYTNPYCVWVAQEGPWVVLADSPAGGEALQFEAGEWTAFIAGVKAGEFDGPTGGGHRRAPAAPVIGRM